MKVLQFNPSPNREYSDLLNSKGIDTDLRCRRFGVHFKPSPEEDLSGLTELQFWKWVKRAADEYDVVLLKGFYPGLSYVYLPFETYFGDRHIRRAVGGIRWISHKPPLSTQETVPDLFFSRLYHIKFGAVQCGGRPVFYSSHDLLHWLGDGDFIWLPRPFDPNVWLPDYTQNKRPRIFFPNIREDAVWKGTEDMLKVAFKLREERSVDIIPGPGYGVPWHTMSEIYRHSDIVVDQIENGIFGYTTVEAMLSGKPVVCNVKFEPENIKPPVVQADKHSLYGRLSWLLDNPHLWEEFGKKGREWAIKYHHPDTIAKSLIETLKQVADNKGCVAAECEHKKISVVVPTHNRVESLKNCLASVFMQDYPNLEVIVVDDGSVDETFDYLCRAARVPYARDKLKVMRFIENQGVGAALNAGVRGATGEIVYIIDDDDFMVPGALWWINRGFECHDVDFIYGAYLIPNNTPVVFPLQFDALKRRISRFTVFLPMGAIAWKRDVFDRLEFDTTLKSCVNIDFQLMAILKRGMVGKELKAVFASCSIGGGDKLDSIKLLLERHESGIYEDINYRLRE